MKELEEHIKSALQKEVDFRLPDNFSDRLIQLIALKAKEERRWELAGIITAGVLFIVALSLTLYLTEFKFDFGALTFLSNHIGLIAFGIFFIFLLQLVDKKLVRRHQTN